MVELHNGAVFGHEAFVRAPRSLGELSFDHLLGAAREQHCQKQLELACLDYALEYWLADRPKGFVFGNISAQTLVQLHESAGIDALLQILRKHRVQPNRMGLDISGYTRIPRLDVLVAALQPLRVAGMQIALDDFKASESSMQAWAKVQPHIVKMAPRWTRNIDDDPENARVVTSLVRLSRGHNSLLLAKSVESEAELRVMRELGVNLAQGYFLGSPSLDLVTTVNLRARAVLSVASR
jgi:EAL domain-containing protein (putative c-di-GMP-specific phosphodiesterase class I)